MGTMKPIPGEPLEYVGVLCMECLLSLLEDGRRYRDQPLLQAALLGCEVRCAHPSVN